jgi:hypothetical protein
VVQTNGLVQRWDGVVNGVDSFVTVANGAVNSLVWDDPTLLFNADLSQFLTSADLTQLSQLRAQYGFYTTGNFMRSYHNLNDKWILDNTGKQWYVLTTNGTLQKWNGIINGADSFTPVSGVNSVVWDDPNLLLHAALNLSSTAQAQLVTLSQNNGFHFAGSYYLNYLGLNEKWFQDAQNNWCYITTQGAIYRAGSQLAQVDAQVWSDPTLLFKAKLSSTAQTQLTQLQRTHGFRTTGDFSQSYHGLNAKWIKDNQGFWYVIRTDGSLQFWNGVINGTDSFSTVATMDTQVWTDPYLLLLA